MSSKNPKQDAHNKGGNDFKKCGGIASDPITEIFHPSYNPPSKDREAYKKGWDNAKKQR